jgi:hypothetical protein
MAIRREQNYQRVSYFLHITTSPHHHITTSPHHHITTSPHHHITTSQRNSHASPTHPPRILHASPTHRASSHIQQARESVFHSTSESTNNRVTFWSIGQLVVLVVLGVWQMRHLKSFFKSKKLV